MTQGAYPPAAPPRPRAGEPGPRLGLSITLMVVGAIIGIASVILALVPIVRIYSAREYAAPSQLTLHLRHERYTVFERTDTGFGFGSRNGITIDPTQVVVTAPDGEPVPVFYADHSETMDRGSRTYKSAVEFVAPRRGDYEIRLSTRPTSVVITRSLQETIKSVVVWFGTGAVGGLVFVAGLVMLIVGTTRRSRARRAAQWGWGPAGWTPDPWGRPAWGPQYPPAPYGPPPQYPPPPPPPYGPPPEPPGRPDDPWAAPPGR